MMKLVARRFGARSAYSQMVKVVERQPDWMGIASMAMRIRAGFEGACLSLCKAAVT
jgi:hypothetical protein